LPIHLCYWRLAVTIVVGAIFAAPLAMPLFDLIRQPEAWLVWTDIDRLWELARNSLALAAGTVALALPIGTIAAVLFYRTDLPGRDGWRFLTVSMLFVPLPLVASAWQAALGHDGWVPALFGTWLAGDADTWRPWVLGLGPAIWVHGVAGLPWVILIVGQGLRWVERELEEDALTACGPLRVLWRVTLRRSWGVLGAAALWVALQTATEITVTDTMQVRTFGEEVYTQMVLGDTHALARSVAVAVPPGVLTGVVVLALAAHLEKHLPALEAMSRAPAPFRLAGWRWPALALVGIAVTVLAGVPLASLVWKVGLAGSPATWSLATTTRYLTRTFRLRASMVAESFGLGAAAGIVAAGLAALVGWLAIESRWLRTAALGVVVAAWVLPGPVVGFGLKAAIAGLLDITHSAWLADVLYYGPSLAPVLWVDLIRFFPFALALVWPIIRLIPVELREAVRVDGARPGQELRYLVGPLVQPAAIQAGLVVAVLSLGELSAGKLVETAGAKTFAHEIFEEMHYGVTNNVAALSLVLLALVAIGGGTWELARRLLRTPNENG
jgi:iron(III) transport system permease protein